MATKALSFDVGDYVVYPKHGVGRVVELQSTEIAGCRLDLYVLRFEKEKMTLRVPVNKADSAGKATNELAVLFKGGKASFTVNGKEVYNTDASNVDASGVIGYRVNHNLDVHLSAIGIHPLH